MTDVIKPALSVCWYQPNATPMYLARNAPAIPRRVVIIKALGPCSPCRVRVSAAWFHIVSAATPVLYAIDRQHCAGLHFAFALAGQ